MTKLSCIILGAGKGTRMKSDKPKVMMPLAGWPMIKHLINTCEKLNASKIVTVIAPGMDDVTATVAPHATAVQEQQLGTGDAAKAGAKSLGNNADEYILVLLGDVPLIGADRLQSLVDAAQATGLSVMAMRPRTTRGYGRLVTDENGFVTRIVEHADCTAEEKNITLVNGGNFCIRADKLLPWLNALKSNNAQNEFYMTDIIPIAAADGVSCTAIEVPEDEIRGMNTRAHLVKAESILQTQLRKNALDSGVGMVDPETVYLQMDTIIGADTIIEPNVVFGPGVTVGSGVHVYAFSHIEGASIADNAEIGPFARIRPKSSIGEGATIGNFVEVNRSNVGAKTKSKHVSYLGDATIGEKSNIGAGTIIANYDGFEKQETSIGNGVFIGSNSTIVAPIKIEDGSYVGAGSAITTDVPENALAVARARSIIRDGWATMFRSKKDLKKKAV